MKVRYRRVDGYISTAYLDDEDTTPGQALYAGADKYTEIPVTVQWDADAEEWKEVA